MYQAPVRAGLRAEIQPTDRRGSTNPTAPRYQAPVRASLRAEVQPTDRRGIKHPSAPVSAPRFNQPDRRGIKHPSAPVSAPRYQAPARAEVQPTDRRGSTNPTGAATRTRRAANGAGRRHTPTATNSRTARSRRRCGPFRALPEPSASIDRATPCPRLAARLAALVAAAPVSPSPRGSRRLFFEVAPLRYEEEELPALAAGLVLVAVRNGDRARRPSAAPSKRGAYRGFGGAFPPPFAARVRRPGPRRPVERRPPSSPSSFSARRPLRVRRGRLALAPTSARAVLDAERPSPRPSRPEPSTNPLPTGLTARKPPRGSDYNLITNLSF